MCWVSGAFGSLPSPRAARPHCFSLSKHSGQMKRVFSELSPEELRGLETALKKVGQARRRAHGGELNGSMGFFWDSKSARGKAPRERASFAVDPFARSEGVILCHSYRCMDRLPNPCFACYS